MSVWERAMRRAAGASTKSDLFDWPWSGTPPSDLFTGSGLVGAQLLQAQQGLPMLGLPALYAVLRIISNGAGMSRMHVYKPAGESRTRATDAYQYDLLHDHPVIGGNAFAWRADIAANVAGTGNAYLRKWKSTRGVIGELEPLDPFRVLPKKVQGQLVFEDSSQGAMVTRTTADIIPVRLGAMRGQLRGLAPITEMRLAVKAGISREVFAQAWLHKRGNPGVVLKMPQTVTPDQAKEIREAFEADYASEENAGRTAVVGGGGDIVAMPVSMADAQFVESTQMTWQTLAGAYQVPMNFLGGQAQRRTFEDDLALAKYGIGPIIDAIDHALTADRDICPPGSGLIVESMPDAILRMSILDRANAYRLLRQGGIETANELRGLENLPPHPDGDVLQQTPVGGAENPGLGGGGSAATGPEGVETRSLDLFIEAQAKRDQELFGALAGMWERKAEDREVVTLLRAIANRPDAKHEVHVKQDPPHVQVDVHPPTPPAKGGLRVKRDAENRITGLEPDPED